MKTFVLRQLSPAVVGSLVADSAVCADNMPLFVPDGAWMCQARMALRIDRLGKSIKPQFARRYYGAFTLVNYLRRADSLAPEGGAIDQCVIHGRWLPIGDAAPEVAVEVADLRYGGVVEVDFSAIDEAISELSRLSTFKTGDIIILPNPILSFTPSPQSAFKGLINSEEVLNFRIL